MSTRETPPNEQPGPAAPTPRQRTKRSARRELEESEAYLRISRRKHLLISLDIFQRNAFELRQVVLLSTNFDYYTEIWRQGNGVDRENYLHTVLQKIHNLVASQYSLVEHSRRFYEKYYKPHGLLPAYPEEINRRFAKDPLARFVKDLRNYFQHYGVIPLTGSMSFRTLGHQDPNDALGLPRAQLLLWDGWSGAARRYLESLPTDKIPVLRLVEEYEDHVISFWRWLHVELEQIHAPDFEEAKRLQRRAFEESHAAHWIGVELKRFEDHPHAHPENIFLMYIGDAAFREIKRSGRSPIEKLDMAIKCFEGLMEMPDDLRPRVIEALRHVPPNEPRASDQPASKQS